jgi:hypothetical protein
MVSMSSGSSTAGSACASSTHSIATHRHATDDLMSEAGFKRVVTRRVQTQAWWTCLRPRTRRTASAAPLRRYRRQRRASPPSTGRDPAQADRSNFWGVVDAAWWRRWVAFSQYDAEDEQQQRGPQPGPINNSGLVMGWEEDGARCQRGARREAVPGPS